MNSFVLYKILSFLLNCAFPSTFQLQFAPMSTQASVGPKNVTSVTSASLHPNNNVVIASGRPQPLVLHKPFSSIVSSGAKITGTYVTMLKPVPKPSEAMISEKVAINTSLSDNMIISKNGWQGSQKFVLTAMPKLTSNRPPVTATTNSQQTKITVLPMAVPKKEPEPIPNRKIFNFQISDGKVHCTDPKNSPVTIICDQKQWDRKDSNENSVEIDLTCDTEEFITENTEKNDISNKVYELSITEESLSNQSESKLVVSSADSNSSNGDQGSFKTDSNKPQKDAQKFTHGVSILKKSFGSINFNEKPPEHVAVVTSNSTFSTVQKPERERRRKSQFSFRSFDEDDISFPDSTLPVKTEEIKEEKVKPEIDNNSDGIFNSHVDFDPKKIFKWDDGVGTLPGSNLKFIINEFNIVEYVTEEDYKKIVEQRLKKAREKLKEDLEEEMRCVECGCYGLQSDFITSDYCSVDCQDTARTRRREAHEIKLKKKKRKFGKAKSENEIKTDMKEEYGSEDDISNEGSSQDKFSYPWACKKKGFSWSKYLDHVKAKAAPVKLFKEPFPYSRNGFRPGMKLEGVDPQHPPYFCVLTVVEVVGYRIRLHFDGYPDNYDFWCNADSMNIFPMGWCEKYGHVLHPPPGYTEDDFNWIQYLKVTKSTAAPKHLFANRAGQAICPNGFRIGMKLEAVDRKDTALVCVASIRDMMDNRILVHFDGWDDIYDYWADPTSPYIHPVGWCDQYGHNLTPPSGKCRHDSPNPELFSWESYLKSSKSSPAPVRAFKQRPACGFKRGMRLECVDKRVPHLIRVATVDDVKEHQIRIHFDGWPDRYSYWVDDDSPDIHPAGWCQKTGHPLEPPLTPDDVYDFLECPTVGCRGQGHIKGMKYATHSLRKYCPYAEENIDAEKVLPDRLLSPDRNPEAVVPFSREPKECKIKPKLGRPPKYLKRETPKPEEEQPEKRPIRTYSKRKYEDRNKEEETEETPEKRAAKFIEESKLLPAERESWPRHSSFLKKYINSCDNPLSWSWQDVVDFVTSMPGCESSIRFFRDEHIDGESFLHLSQKDLITFLKIRMGPAVKLYNAIVLLRKQTGMLKEEN